MIYKYNNGTSGRFHSGFIAQDVLQSIDHAGLSTSDFAAYIETTDLYDNIVCGLRYDEFIALNTWQIQKLKEKINAMQTEIVSLKGQIGVTDG
jgi:hypothetical protein